MKMTYNFYDTCSLLTKGTLLEDKNEQIIISSITLDELENIKTSANKDANIKYTARQLLRTLNDNPDLCQVIIYKEKMIKPIQKYDLSITNDMKILATALSYNKQNKNHPIDNFITNDLTLKCIAKLFLSNVSSIEEERHDPYTGYIEVILNENEITELYQNLKINKFNLLINQYVIIYNQEKEIIDKMVWDGDTYRTISYGNLNSTYFGNVKPFKNDPYQALAVDSFLNNKITMIKGPAGSGKTFLSLAFLLNALERNKIDKIIVFCNTVATKNSAKLGFYPGTRDEKLLDSQIGNLLSSKLGDKMMVEKLIDENKLVLLPLSDIRGYDTTGMRAGIYISEAQNMDIGLMKLSLQRIGEDSICIIDGDLKTQVDDINFSGLNNGMRRASEILRNNDIYGEVELKQIHRSKIAELAEQM